MLGPRQGNFLPLYGGSGAKNGKVKQHLSMLFFALWAEILANFMGHRFGLRAFIFCPWAFQSAFEIFGKPIGILTATLVCGLYAKAIGFTFWIDHYLASLLTNLLFLMCPVRKMLVFVYMVALYLFSGPCDGWLFFLDSIYSFAIFSLVMKLEKS
ncbi:MAG: hypothetical protein LBH49_00310 [Puniceicoccales bacterium]|jgi:hypothetical protein|nr:hypothetical protein [Puniceicoccales bacterium]